LHEEQVRDGIVDAENILQSKRGSDYLRNTIFTGLWGYCSLVLAFPNSDGWDCKLLSIC
jgi:hypothetical protein